MKSIDHDRLLKALTLLCTAGAIPPKDAQAWPVFLHQSGQAITPTGKAYLETFAPEVIREHPEVQIKMPYAGWNKPPSMDEAPASHVLLDREEPAPSPAKAAVSQPVAAEDPVLAGSLGVKSRDEAREYAEAYAEGRLNAARNLERPTPLHTNLAAQAGWVEGSFDGLHARKRAILGQITWHEAETGIAPKR